MKQSICKTFLVVLTFVALVSFDTVPPQESVSAAETYVYICTGPKSKRYHKTSECKGLDSCSKEIKKVTLSYAEEIDRTPCKICYK